MVQRKKPNGREWKQEAVMWATKTGLTTLRKEAITEPGVKMTMNQTGKDTKHKAIAIIIIIIDSIQRTLTHAPNESQLVGSGRGPDFTVGNEDLAKQSDLSKGIRVFRGSRV